MASTIKRTKKKKITTSKSPRAKIILLERIKITNKLDIKNYIQPKSDLIRPKIWELSNRKTFYNWLHNNLDKYDSNNSQPDINKDASKQEFFRIQKLVRDFMQADSPYRGLLLFHELGTGKTCSSIAIAEAIQNRSEVLILSKAALESNYKANIFKCGRDYMRTNHYWVFVKGETEVEKEIIKTANIPHSIIRENGGVYLIDYSVKNPNYNELGSHKSKIEKQILATLEKRFKFIHTDDTRIIKKIKPDLFDNKVIIVDEVHNLVNSMANESSTGVFFYDILLNCKNSKIVFLSGTPLMNRIFEATRLFNILRGPINTLVYRLVPEFGKNIQWRTIKQKLITNPYVDQVIIDKIRKQVKITKNPDNFITHHSNKGLVYKPSSDISFDEFADLIEKIMVTGRASGGYNKNILTKEINTCLPEQLKEFNNTFYNMELNKLKKKDVFRKRVAGLTSFYGKIEKASFPTLRSVEKVLVPMSDYQLSKYQPFRISEIEKQKKQLRRKKYDEQLKSSYRLYSRLHCSFVFPDEIGSPYNKENIEAYEKLEDVIGSDELDDIHQEIDIKEADKMFKNVSTTSKKFLDALDKEKDNLLSIDNGSLYKHAPKYAEIIKRIMESEGCCFVYSQFVEMVGLNTFSIALRATGKFAPFQIKKVDGEYILNTKKGDEDKMKYIMYSGSTNKELREIYRLIYNSEFESLPTNCQKLKKQLQKMYNDDENLHGNIIKVFLTTRSGAEGVDLKHIRQIHIMEPYWQPVLIKQVIGRGVRFQSHTRLPKEEQFVDVFIYMSVFSDEQVKDQLNMTIRRDIAINRVSDYDKRGKPITSDENLYITAERKKEIIDETQNLIKESAFDCTLNYADNIQMNENKNIVCLNYDVGNREDENSYLFTPGIEDTVDLVEVQQEDIISIIYEKIELPKNSGKFYWRIQNPQPGQNKYLYDGSKNPAKMARKPKPVAEIIVVSGKKKVRFFKKKSKTTKK